MAYPVTLNGRTYTLADFEGTNYVDGFPDALEDFVTQAGNIYTTTSTSSVAIGTGSKTFTVADSGKPYIVGTPLRISDTAAPTTNWIDGIVTSYSGTTLIVDAVAYAGSGTISSWNINIGGGPIAYTGTLPIAQGGTGATTAADARTNLDTYSKSEADSRFLNVSGEASDVTMTGNVTIGDAGTDTLTVNAAATFAESIDVTGTITADGLTVDGDATFGDNNKAIFGAGSDLQIYHDGTNSFIADVGTGNLKVRGEDLRLEDTSGNRYLQGVAGGATTLYYAGSALVNTTSTGLDVTGTVTADGLTVDGDIEATGGDVDIINAQPRINLKENDTTDLDVTLRLNAGDFIIETRSDAGSALGDRIRAASNGDISFYEDTGTTPKFFWDASAEALGIGTTSPNAPLHVQNGTSGGSANVAADDLIVEASGSGGITISTPSTSAGTLAFGDENVSIQGRIAFSHASNSMQFYTSNTSESMRIDSSGNVLVGTTNSDPALNNGNGISLDSNTGLIQASRASGVVAHLNRKTSNGNIVNFRKDGNSVGSISVTGSATAYNTSSDYRLKEDWQPVTGASDRVLALNPVNFAWKSDGTRVDGFLAHEAQEVVPEAVHGEKDEVDEDGNPVYQGIDQSKLVPLLTAALQEAMTKIDDLEARVAELEAK